MRSAVAPVNTSGVFPTAIPRQRPALRSMLSKPTAKLAIARRRGRGLEQGGVDAVGEHADQGIGVLGERAKLGRARGPAASRTNLVARGCAGGQAHRRGAGA